VYVKFVEEHSLLRKDKKLEMNVKTSREGIAHVPNVPMGRALVQVCRRRVENVRALARHHRPEADDQGASGEAAEVVLKEIRSQSLRISNLENVNEKFCPRFSA